MHTFLFREGLWAARGDYTDEAMNRGSMEGETRVTHRPGEWINEGRMIIELGGKRMEIENRYRIVPFAVGSDFTRWESVNPALGTLRGHFIVVDSAILSSCTSIDHRYTGTEFLLQEAPDRYINRGALFSSGGRVSSWSVTLSKRE